MSVELHGRFRLAEEYSEMSWWESSTSTICAANERVDSGSHNMYNTCGKASVCKLKLLTPVFPMLSST